MLRERRCSECIHLHRSRRRHHHHRQSLWTQCPLVSIIAYCTNWRQSFLFIVSYKTTVLLRYTTTTCRTCRRDVTRRLQDTTSESACETNKNVDGNTSSLRFIFVLSHNHHQTPWTQCALVMIVRCTSWRWPIISVDRQSTESECINQCNTSPPPIPPSHQSIVS